MNENANAPSWWKRLSGGLKRSSSALGSAISDLVSKRKLDAQSLEELESELIRADLGVETAARIIAALREGRYEKDIAPDEVKAVLAGEIEKSLVAVAKPLEITARPFVILVVGVNGSGKTTTIGKLAAKFRSRRQDRDAGGRATPSAPRRSTSSKSGASVPAPRWWRASPAPTRPDLPSTPSPQAKAEDDRHCCCRHRRPLAEQDRTDERAGKDRAGDRARSITDAPHAVLLVLDATVGQNALSQVEMFQKVAGVTGLVMTKLDGSARGGILVAIADPIRPAGAFHRRRRGHRGSQRFHRARFRAGDRGIGVNDDNTVLTR